MGLVNRVVQLREGTRAKRWNFARKIARQIQPYRENRQGGLLPAGGNEPDPCLPNTFPKSWSRI